MAVRVDAAGLESAAAQLSGTGQVGPAQPAQAPGSDATSVAAIAQLNAASEAFVALLQHGEQVREVGAQTVTKTGKYLSSVDEGNAAAIAAGTTPDSGGGLGSVPDIAAPNLPVIPEIPGALAPVPGEVHSQGLYNGPGSASLHELANYYQRTASTLREAGHTTTSAASIIDNSWNDGGQQQAGANTRRHGQWLSDMADHADTLASRARGVASSFETAKHATPSPEEFTQARQDVQNARAQFQASHGLNAEQLQAATQKLAQMHSQATESATTYHSDVSSATLTTSTQTLKTAPAIAGGDGNSSNVQEAKWKKGDKRHWPIVRGHDGLGPAQPADGPGWVEIGPESGNFVRKDEVPDLKIYPPGELGPSAFYDENDHEHGWIELGPGTGAWVPDDEFPGAVIRSPGALGPYGHEEYLPGSGIWLPSQDFIPDPADPAPPSGATYPA